MTRKNLIKRAFLRVSAETPRRPNLLDLEQPARRIWPLLYWSGLAAAVLFHGGLLGYLIGHERPSADHAPANVKAGALGSGDGVTQPLAKGDRQNQPRHEQGAAADRLSEAADGHPPREAEIARVPPDEAQQMRNVAWERPLVAPEDLIALADESSGEAFLKVSLPQDDESDEPRLTAAPPTPVELPGDITGLSETHLALAAGELKTSTREATDPDVAESGDEMKQPDPAGGMMPDAPAPAGGSEVLPEDRGIADIVPLPAPPNAHREAEPAVETAPPAEAIPVHFARQAMSPDAALPEDRGAADILALPDRPAMPAAAQPVAETPAAADPPAAPAMTPSDIPVPKRRPLLARATEETPPSRADEPAAPAHGVAIPERRRSTPLAVIHQEAPASPLPEDNAAAATPKPWLNAEPPPKAEQPSPQAAEPAKSPAVEDGVDAPNMPLPKRRSSLTKSIDDPQTTGVTGTAPPVEEKSGKAAGSIEAYRQMVRARLSEFKPNASPSSGMVVVSFTLSKSGEVNSASILRSSGEAELDESVLAAVRRAAPFPKTPQGAKASHRQFVVPFLFRS